MRLRTVLHFTTYHLSSQRCHSSVPKETSLACDFSTGRMWEYLSEQPASLAVPNKDTDKQTSKPDFLLTVFSTLRCAARLVGNGDRGRTEEPGKKQQLGLLEGNKKEAVPTKCIAGSISEKRGKINESVKRHYNCYHTKYKGSKRLHQCPKLNYLEETVNL